jgi:hypothetical protein
MADGSVGFQSVDGRPSSSHFIFDQETDDPYSYLLFEFTIRWPGAREGHQTFAFLNRF